MSSCLMGKVHTTDILKRELSHSNQLLFLDFIPGFWADYRKTFCRDFPGKRMAVNPFVREVVAEVLGSEFERPVFNENEGWY